jgi:hypothetical protein
MHMFGRGGESRKGDKPKRARLDRGWLWALTVLVGVALVLLVLWIGPWLLTHGVYQELTADQALKARNDVRTALVQAVAGLGVASGAVVTYRTFRHTRLEQDRAYVTDTYTRAVEQLGHEQAPVRLGALYSLVSLAQDNPPRRQTVVDVLCAYLRMPYTPPPDHGEPTADGHSDTPVEVTRHATANVPRHDPAQELQVRQTAQRLLAGHLRPSDISPEDAQRIKASPKETFWPGIGLDLTGATLVDFDLRDISVMGASFTKATFSGVTPFARATFSGDAWFDEATFSGPTGFDGATFSRGAFFTGATFSKGASFDGVRVLHLDDPYLNRGDYKARRVWPMGWTVRPDADDPSRGTLVSSATGAH